MDKNEKKDKQEQKAAPSKLPMIIGGVVVLVLVLVIGGIFAMKSMSAPSEASEVAGESEEVGYQHTGIYYSQFDAFITCLDISSQSSFTYLKFVPQLELSNVKVESEIASKIPIIEDKINSVMTDLDWNVVKSQRGRERQAERLKDSLNELLESGEIIRIYFTTFVAQ